MEKISSMNFTPICCNETPPKNHSFDFMKHIYKYVGFLRDNNHNIRTTHRLYCILLVFFLNNAYNMIVYLNIESAQGFIIFESFIRGGGFERPAKMQASQEATSPLNHRMRVRVRLFSVSLLARPL